MASQDQINYEINENTGTTTIDTQLHLENASRNGMYKAFRDADKVKLDNDHRGHLLAARFKGPAVQQNLFGQNKDLNLKSYKNVENAEAKMLQQGAKIDTTRTAYMSNPSDNPYGARPDAFMISDTITYADGHSETVHESFTNISHQEQMEFDQQLIDEDFDAPNYGDTLREMFSPEEYSELMEETDPYLSNISDDFEASDYSFSLDDENDIGAEADVSIDGGDISSDFSDND